MYLSLMNFGWMLIAHWVGDFLLQGTRMATLKGQKAGWLLYHVGVYSLPVLAVSLWSIGGREALYFTLVNAIGHTVTDAVSSRLNMRYRERPRIFFVIIGTDQLLHLLLLFYSYKYFAEAAFRLN